MAATNYPAGLTIRPILTWPGVQTPRRVVSPFTASEAATLKDLRRELREIHAKTPVLQIALRESQFRLDGLPKAGVMPEHPGVILSFDSPDGSLSFPCDSYLHWIDNLRAIVLTMEKLRAIKRYGVTRHSEQYAGWRQIEAAAPASITTTQTAIEIIEREASVSDPGGTALPVLIRLAKRRAHPDMPGGSAERFRMVNEAEDFLRREGLL